MFRKRVAAESLNSVLRETRTSKSFNVCKLAELKNVLREIMLRLKIKSYIELNGTFVQKKAIFSLLLLG